MDSSVLNNDSNNSGSNFNIKAFVEGDIFDLAGLENMPDDQKEQIMTKMMESVRDRVLVRIVDELGEIKKDQFFRLLDDGDDQDIKSFLSDNNIDINALVAQEALIYKKEFLDNLKQ